MPILRATGQTTDAAPYALRQGSRLGGTARQRTTVAGNVQVLSSAATGLTDFLQARRVCADSLLGQVGLDPERLGSPNVPIGLDQYCAIMELAARRSQNPGFGLAYGQQFKPDMLGMIGYIAISSPTLLAAAENLAGYFKYHQQGTVTSLTFEAPFYHLAYAIRAPGIAERRQDAIITLGMFCNVFRHCAGDGWCPDEVYLESAAPECRVEIEAAFGAPVRFNRATNALLFRPERADLPMPKADPRLLDILCVNLVQIGMGRPDETLSDRIRAIIRRNIAAPRLDIGLVSDALCLPRWTLQRRLAEANTSFAALVDDVRNSIAKDYIAKDQLPIGAISELLGYSEVSAFTRAFKRMNGLSPSQFKRAG